jgi:hypothetical protein
MFAPLPPDSNVALGPAWAANTVNCVPFRMSGVLSRRGARYVGFYDPHGDVVVASLVAGALTERAVIPAARKPFDAHLSISLGMDSDGRLHVAYGAHDSRMQIARTHRPGLGAGFSEPAWLSGGFARQASYPMFLSLPDEDLILLFRDGSFASGDIRTMRFDCGSALWRDDPVALISGRTTPGCERGPYLNTPVVGPRGQVVLFLVWRLPPGVGVTVTNIGIACLVSDNSLRGLADVDGAIVALPVTPATAPSAIAVPARVNLINQAAAAVRTDGTPMVLTYWNDDFGIPQYRLGWREGSRWRVSTVSRFTTQFELSGPGTLPLPHSRPELLLDPDGRARVIFRSRELGGRLLMTSLVPPDYGLDSARHQILVDEDLGYYEPVLDRSAAEGELALYVQWCDQEQGGDTKKTGFAQAEARLMTWRHERLA